MLALGFGRLARTAGAQDGIREIQSVYAIFDARREAVGPCRSLGCFQSAELV